MLAITTIYKTTKIIIIIKNFRDDCKGIMKMLLYRQKQNHYLLKFYLFLYSCVLLRGKVPSYGYLGKSPI